MATADSINIRIPSQLPDYSDGDMAGFSNQYRKAKSNERKAALRSSQRSLKVGTFLQYALSFACFYHGARYALTMGEDNSTVLGGWDIHYGEWFFTVPSVTTNAALYVLCIVCLIAAGTFFAARLPELFAQFKIAGTGMAKTSTALVISMHIVAICSSSALSFYTTQSILQFSSQTVTDASETSGDKAQAALNLKNQYARDIQALEQEIVIAADREYRAKAADDKHVASIVNYAKEDHGWLLATDHPTATPPRKAFYDEWIAARDALAALKKEKAALKRESRAATADYKEAIKAPNSVEKSLEEQGKMYGGMSPERLNLIVSQIMSILIEFFRITLSIVSRTSLAHALIRFTVSEYQRWSKEARAEYEAEDRARRLEEATMAPVRAKEEAHLRVAEAHAERIKARTEATVAAIDMDEEPDDLILNTDALAALENKPSDDAVRIPAMPSERATGFTFSPMMAVDSVDGYDELSTFYQDALRRAEASWRGGTHHLTHGAINSEYGIKSNNARLVFLRWLEESGRAKGKDTPTGRKYSKVRIAA